MDEALKQAIERKKIADKKYREANRDKILQKKKEYQEANKEKIAQYKKKYREANIDDIKAKDKQRYNKRARARVISRLQAGLNVRDATLHKYNIDKTEFQKK